MEELRKQLFNIVNEASKSLPPEAIFYICKDFYRDVNEDYQRYLANLAARKAAVQREEEKEHGE